MRLKCVIVATLLYLLLSAIMPGGISATPPNPDLTGPENILDSVTVDLDGDGTLETIVITFETIEDGRPLGGKILVYHEIDGIKKSVWEKDGFNPWKLEIGDVDGNNIKEIAVGVWKTSPFDPVMADRIFFWEWDGETMQRKWLGSRLSRRFEDFILCDVNSDGWDELVALEIVDEDYHRVAVYRWDLFGFEWLGCSDNVGGSRALREEDGVPYVETGSSLCRLEFNDNRVEIKQNEEEM